MTIKVNNQTLTGTQGSQTSTQSSVMESDQTTGTQTSNPDDDSAQVSLGADPSLSGGYKLPDGYNPMFDKRVVEKLNSLGETFQKQLDEKEAQMQQAKTQTSDLSTRLSELEKKSMTKEELELAERKEREDRIAQLSAHVSERDSELERLRAYKLKNDVLGKTENADIPPTWWEYVAGKTEEEISLSIKNLREKLKVMSSTTTQSEKAVPVQNVGVGVVPSRVAANQISGSQPNDGGQQKPLSTFSDIRSAIYSSIKN